MSGKDIVKTAEQYKGETGLKFCKAYGFSYIVPWCCIFVWYVFKKAKAAKLFFGGDKVCNCGVAENWCERHLKKIKKISDVEPGDIVFYSWTGNKRDHVGIVTGHKKSEIESIEGNSGSGDPKASKVMIRTRAKKYIYSIYRPAYKKDNKEPEKEEKDYTDKIKKFISGKYKDPKKALGSDYKIVEKEANRITGLTKKVINGKLGKGEERKKILGSDYKLVQWNVNRVLKEKTKK